MPTPRNRERNYDRIPIDPACIEFLDEELAVDECWTYVPKAVKAPDDDYPIGQTYVDVVLDGCLDYGEEFAEEFIASTEGWEAPLDDRGGARYAQEMPGMRTAEIDKLLEAQEWRRGE